MEDIDFAEELARVKAKRNPYADWRDSPVAQCNKYMLHNQLNCDVLMRVGRNFGEPEDFGCHRYILTSRSSVFAKLFAERDDEINSEGNLVNGVLESHPANGVNGINGKDMNGVYESDDGDCNISGSNANTDDYVIELSDVSPTGFYELLTYMYYEEAEVDEENAFGVYHAAFKFHMRPLEERCKQYIFDTEVVDEGSVCELLETSITFLCHFLTSECVIFIDANPKVCATEEFKSLSKPAQERVYLHVNKIK